MALHLGVMALRKFSTSVGVDKMAMPTKLFEADAKLRNGSAIKGYGTPQTRRQAPATLCEREKLCRMA